MKSSMKFSNLLSILILGISSLGSTPAFGDQWIRIPKGSPFLKRLIPFNILPEHQLSHYPLRDVGQIIAVESFEITKEKQKTWSELDPELTGKMEIDLKTLSKNSIHRTAVGVAYLPLTTLLELQKGTPLSVSRYGLKQFQSEATVVGIRQKGKETGEVVFQISQGHSWVPGATCEIEFRSVRRKPMRVPISSLIHIGAEEYVIRILEEGVFEPKHVSVLDMDHEFAIVDGDIKPGYLIVNEGAILLKLEVQKHVKASPATETGDL